MTEQEIKNYIEGKGFKFNMMTMEEDSLVHYYGKDDLILYYYIYLNGENPSWKYDFPELLLAMGLYKGEKFITSFCAMSFYEHDVNDPMSFNTIDEALEKEKYFNIEKFYDLEE